MIFPMTDREMLQQLRSLSPDDLMAIWQNAPDPDNLTKRERMARDLSQTMSLVAAAAAPLAALTATVRPAPAG